MINCNQCGETQTHEKLQENELSRRLGWQVYGIYHSLGLLVLICALILGLFCACLLLPASPAQLTMSSAFDIALGFVPAGIVFAVLATPDVLHNWVIGYSVYHFRLENGEDHCHRTDPRLDQVPGIKVLLRVRMAGWFQRDAFIAGKNAAYYWKVTHHKKCPGRGYCFLTASKDTVESWNDPDVFTGRQQLVLNLITRHVDLVHLWQMYEELEKFPKKIVELERSKSDLQKELSDEKWKLGRLSLMVFKNVKTLERLKDTTYRSKHAQAIRESLEEALHAVFKGDQRVVEQWEYELEREAQEADVPINPS